MGIPYYILMLALHKLHRVKIRMARQLPGIITTSRWTHLTVFKLSVPQGISDADSHLCCRGATEVSTCASPFTFMLAFQKLHRVKIRMANPLSGIFTTSRWTHLTVFKLSVPQVNSDADSHLCCSGATEHNITSSANRLILSTHWDF